jgi:hypothetical protein
MAGSITVVTATHFTLLFIEEFLNFPNRSLTVFKHFLSCASPLPSRDRSTPKVWRHSKGETRSIVWRDPSCQFFIWSEAGIGRSMQEIVFFLKFTTGRKA